MSTPREVYTNKLSQFNQKIAKLEDANRADIQRIPELEKEYQTAINAIEIEQADSIHAEIDRLQRSTEIRQTQIAALKNADHPERQTAKAEYLDALKVFEKRIIEEHTPIHEEVMAARDAYIRLAAASVPLYNEFHRNAREYHNAKNDGLTMLYPRGLAGGPAHYQVTENDIFKMAEKQ